MYQNLMLYGGITALVGILAAIINMVSGVTGVTSGNRSMGSVLAFHLVAGLLYLGGGLSFVIGLVMFLIHHAKS
jgi:hypothetical protein